MTKLSAFDQFNGNTKLITEGGGSLHSRKAIELRNSKTQEAYETFKKEVMKDLKISYNMHLFGKSEEEIAGALMERDDAEALNESLEGSVDDW